MAFTVRFPYFFYSELAWDESTFIIVGQDILNGNLPYTHLWDNKPPLAFLFYVLFLLFFGKSIVAVRLGGFLFIYMSAYLVYKIGERIYNQAAGFFSAILVIVFASTFGSGQATMTEHLVLLPVSVVLLFLLTKGHTNRNIFFIGLLLGITVLIRTNMAYFGMGVGFILFLYQLKSNIFVAGKKVFILLLGIFVPIIVVAYVYFSNNNLGLLINSTITAPLAFISQKQSSFAQYWSVLFKIKDILLSRNFLIWLAFACGLIISYIKPNTMKDKRLQTTTTLVLFLSVSFSIIKTGRGYSHYLIQLIPFMAVIGSVCLSFIFSLRRMWLRGLLYIVLIIGLFFPLKSTANEYKLLLKKICHHEPLFRGIGYDISNYLNEYNVSGKYVYFCECHIGYWLTNAKVPTKYAHPPNVGEESFLKAVDGKRATSENTLQEILMKKPLFIVKPVKLWYFNEKCNSILDNEIKKNYELDKKIEHINIYKRKPSSK